MKVRLTEGRRAGEVVDMPYHVAAPLLRERRVLSLDEEPAAPLMPVTVATVTAPVANKQQPPKGKK